MHVIGQTQALQRVSQNANVCSRALVEGFKGFQQCHVRDSTCRFSICVGASKAMSSGNSNSSSNPSNNGIDKSTLKYSNISSSSSAFTFNSGWACSSNRYEDPPDSHGDPSQNPSEEHQKEFLYMEAPAGNASEADTKRYRNMHDDSTGKWLLVSVTCGVTCLHHTAVAV
jgi:hypothetical protein